MLTNARMCTSHATGYTTVASGSLTTLATGAIVSKWSQRFLTVQPYKASVKSTFDVGCFTGLSLSSSSTRSFHVKTNDVARLANNS